MAIEQKELAYIPLGLQYYKKKTLDRFSQFLKQNMARKRKNNTIPRVPFTLAKPLMTSGCEKVILFSGRHLTSLRHSVYLTFLNGYVMDKIKDRQSEKIFICCFFRNFRVYLIFCNFFFSF